MTEPLTEADFIEAFSKAGLDLGRPEDVEELRAALREGLTRALAERGKPTQKRETQVETAEQYRARLLAEAERMGDRSPETALKIGFMRPPKPAAEEQQPPDVANITDPAELLRIGFAKKGAKR